MKDGGMEAPIEIVEDQIEAMTGVTTEDPTEDMTEVAEGIMIEEVIQIGDTMMITEEAEAILVEDMMTETIVTDETMDLAEDTTTGTTVTEETMDLAEDTAITILPHKVPPHCPPVMTSMKRCDGESART